MDKKPQQLQRCEVEVAGITLVVHLQAAPGASHLATDDLSDYGHKSGFDPSVDNTGLQLWPAARALCCGLAVHAASLRLHSRNVLELGAGAGLPGLLAARLGAPCVMLTDNDTAVLEGLQASIAANDLSHACCVRALDWADVGRCPCLGQAGLVLAADVLYSCRHTRLVHACVRALLRDGGVLMIAHEKRLAVFSDPITGEARTEDEDEPYVLFCKLMLEAGFEQHAVSELETRIMSCLRFEKCN